MIGIRRSCGRCGANLRVEIARDLKSAVETGGDAGDRGAAGVGEGDAGGSAACGAFLGSRGRELCVSLAAGIPLKNLRAWLGEPPIGAVGAGDAESGVPDRARIDAGVL